MERFVLILGVLLLGFFSYPGDPKSSEAAKPIAFDPEKPAAVKEDAVICPQTLVYLAWSFAQQRDGKDAAWPAINKLFLKPMGEGCERMTEDEPVTLEGDFKYRPNALVSVKRDGAMYLVRSDALKNRY